MDYRKTAGCGGPAVFELESSFGLASAFVETSTDAKALADKPADRQGDVPRHVICSIREGTL